jgi:diamine N-acetyltransferase
MTTTLIQAGSGDIELLLELMPEFYQYEHLTFDPIDTRQAVSTLLANSSLGQIWLIYHQEDIAGYVVLTFGYSLEFFGRDAFVDELYLREAYRGKGIGLTAIEWLEKVCRQLDIKALHLEVARENIPAQKLYRKTNFYDHDRYLMTKLIKSN